MQCYEISFKYNKWGELRYIDQLFDKFHQTGLEFTMHKH